MADRTGARLTDPPLAHDPAREAVDPMRGFSYQVLCSVLAWIELSDEAVLYLEGAEDFDYVEGPSVTVTQVKDTERSGKVTLRTEGITDAIAHYWDHRLRNPGRHISFRYLTTSGVGMERGDPLGEGIPGIEVWRGAKTEGDPVRQSRYVSKLKAFLIEDARLPRDLRDFLAAASDTEILDRLIRPIEWDTEAGSAETVLQAIRDRLVAHGHVKRVPAHDAEAVVGHLHLEAWTVATREKDRALDRAGFIRLFDEHTHVSIPKADLTALVGQLLGGAESVLPLDAVAASARLVVEPPPLPLQYFHRATVLRAIQEAVRRPIAVLQGSTGTGKTTATASFAAETDRPCGWIDLRGSAGDAVRLRLTAALEYAGRSVEGLPLVLDDLDPGLDPRSYEGALARLADAQRRNGVPLLITSAQDLSQRLCQAIGFDSADTYRMPPFTRDEIDRFLAQCGCGDECRATWAGLVELTTQGHPQLVHARVSALKAAGFPPPSAKDLMETPRDVLDARMEARRLLSQLDSAARELIYRLSLTIGMFNRQRLIAIANAPPQIVEPGNAVDRLIGPWIEAITPTHYRISPLVRSAGEEAHGKDWSRRMHGTIARTLLQERTLTPDDISGILMHALVAEDGSAMARLSTGLLNARTAVWRAIATTASWFTHIATDAGMKMPAENADTLFLIRFMQYRMAAVVGSDVARAIAARFDDEFPRGVAGTSGRLSRLMFLAQLLLRDEVKYPLGHLVACAAEYVALSDGLSDVLAQIESHELDRRLLGPDGAPDRAMIAGSALLPRITTLDDLIAFLDGLDGLEQAPARRILWAVGGEESMARMLLDRAWLAESKSASPDWTRVQSAAQRAYALARQLDVQGLARAAAKAVVRIADEDLKTPEAALALADRFAADIGEFPALQDARARVIARQGNDGAALELWRVALPAWEAGEGDLTPIYSHRDAALAASRLGRWGEAASLLHEGAARTTFPEMSAFRAGLLIDAGFALWKAGNAAGALERFIEALEGLDALQSQAMTDPVFSVQKRAGHTLMWVAAVAEGHPPPGFSEPPPACCSNLDPMPDPRPEHTPIDFLIADMVRFEHFANIGSSVFRRYSDRLRTSPLGLVRLNYAVLRARRSLATLEVDGLLLASVDEAEALSLAQQYYRNGPLEGTSPLPEDAQPKLEQGHHDLILNAMVFGAYALAARGLPEEAPIDQWRQDAETRGVRNAVGSFLDAYDALFIARTLDPWSALFDRQGGWASQNLAALCLAIREDTDPDRMIRCHGLWALQLGQLPNRDLIADDVAKLVTIAWQRLATRPFLLAAPRVSVPALQAAISAPLHGWAKTKSVLMAALEAVSLSASDPARRAIEALSS